MNKKNNKKSHTVIAIDGPSASGKSSVSRAVARRLGWVYVDSGAVYRGLTWELLRRGVDTRDAAEVEDVLPDVRPEFFLDADRGVRFSIDKAVLDAELRSDEVCQHVSYVAAVPAVRTQVTAWLRDMTRFGNLVMEGRDIGTAVFPDAQLKIYLDADIATRARRRHGELQGRRVLVDVQDVGESLQQRDDLDRGRALNPLQIAEDAQVVDTTSMSLEDVAAHVLAAYRELAQP